MHQLPMCMKTTEGALGMHLWQAARIPVHDRSQHLCVVEKMWIPRVAGVGLGLACGTPPSALCLVCVVVTAIPQLAHAAIYYQVLSCIKDPRESPGSFVIIL